eukprot:gene13019-17451_t
MVESDSKEVNSSQFLKNDILSVYVVHIDHIMQNDDINVRVQGKRFEEAYVRMPIFRIFGSTATGQKICVNIHGALPYVYIRPESITHASFDSVEMVSSYLPGINNTLEELLKLKSNNKMKLKHIHKLEVVKRKTLYGFHSDVIIFVKVFMYDPADITRIAGILEDGPLSGIMMQTYESHIPYLLKVTSDYNIPPMGWMHIEKCLFREPLPEAGEVKDNQKVAYDSSQGSKTKSTFHLTPLNQVETHNHSFFKSVNSPQLTDINGNLSGYLTQSTVPKDMIWSNYVIKSNDVISYDPSSENSDKQYYLNNNSELVDDLNVDGYDIEDVFRWSQSNISPNNKPNTEKDPSPEIDQLSGHQINDNLGNNVNIDELLEGLNWEDIFKWSQNPFTSNNNQGYQPYTSKRNDEKMLIEVISDVNDSSNYIFMQNKDNLNHDSALSKIAPLIEKRNVMEKSTSCDIEIDVHVDHIINARMKKKGFGSELWEEELIRCTIKGLPPDVKVNLPSTQTCHRVKQQYEINFLERLENLLMKGNVLRGVSKQLLSQCSSESEKVALHNMLSPFSKFATQKDYNDNHQSSLLQSPNLNPSFSQSLSRSSSNSKSFQSVIKTDSNDLKFCSPITQLSERFPLNDSSLMTPNIMTQSNRDLSLQTWATDRIMDANSQSKSDRSRISLFRDSEILIEEYVHSQMSENKKVTDHIIPIISKESFDFLEEEEVIEDIEQELQDIFSSTQMTVDMIIDNQSSTKLSNSYHKVVQNTSPSFKDISSSISNNNNLWLESSMKINSKPPVPPVSLIPSIQKTSKILSNPKLNDLNNSQTNYSEKKSISSAFDKKKRHNNTVKFADDGIVLKKAKFNSMKTSDQTPSFSNTRISSVAFNYDNIIDLTNNSSQEDDDYEVNHNYNANTSNNNNNNNLFSQIISQNTLYSNACSKPSYHLFPSFHSPKVDELSNLSIYGLQNHINQPAYCSKKQDLPKLSSRSDSSKALLLKKHPLKSKYDMEYFDGGFPLFEDEKNQKQKQDELFQSYFHKNRKQLYLFPTFVPPSPVIFNISESQLSNNSHFKMNNNNKNNNSKSKDLKSQISSPTQTPYTGVIKKSDNNKNINCNSDNIGAGDQKRNVNRMSRLTLLSVEIFCVTRQHCLSNPQFDAIKSIVWIADDKISSAEEEMMERISGVIVFTDDEKNDLLEGEAFAMRQGLGTMNDVQINNSNNNIDINNNNSDNNINNNYN